MKFSLLTSALIVSLFIITTFIVIYFSKERLKTKETKIYKILLISNFIGIILQISCDYISYNYNVCNNFIGNFILKLLLIYFIFWVSILFLYLCTIILKKINVVKNIVLITFIIFSIAIFISPYIIYRDIENNIFYGYGLSANLVYVYSSIYTIIMLIILIINKKLIKSKKVIPIFIFIISGFLSMIIQMFYPYILIPVIVESYICCLLYFTIENPDVKLLEKIEMNRKIIERNNEEKSNLLFKISQDVRVPIKNLEIDSLNMLSLKKKDDLIKIAKKINNESKHLSFIIDNLLDISTMDINKIKLYKTKIDIYNLLTEFNLLVKNKIDVNFNYNLNNEIPLLYGDDIRLKQILYSIINYSFKDRNSKLINLDISGLLRYDICRLIINIKDDGKSLEVDRINEILNYNEELIEKELENINIDIKDIYSIIKILNGNFYIKADKDIGNSYTIIIDYEIVDKLSSNYFDKYFNKKKVLLINDDTEELKKYVSILKNNDIEVTTSMFGKDSIDRIRNKEKYDLIIIDDEMQPYNAIKTLEELKKIDKFKTKVIIMIGLNKEFIKEHYINDYNFTDFLLKRNYKKELDRIIKKYL